MYKNMMVATDSVKRVVPWQKAFQLKPYWFKVDKQKDVVKHKAQ